MSQITREQYEALVQAHRDQPGNIAHSARVVGISRVTARRAYVKGWPRRGPEWGPIKRVIHEEQRAARGALKESGVQARVDAAEEQLRRSFEAEEAARQEAVASRRQEAEIVRGERANVMALIAVTQSALRGALQQASRIEEQIRSGIDANGKPIPLEARVRILERLARMVRLAGESAQDVVRMERLLLGEPTDILGHRNLDSVPEEEAIERLKRSGEMARRMEERRERRPQLLRLVGGGAAAASGDE